MPGFKSLTLFILFLIAYPANLFAAMPPVILSDQTDTIYLPTYSEIFEDKTGKLTLNDLLSGQYTFEATPPGVSLQSPIEPGFTRSTYWLKTTIRNESSETNWYLNVWGGLSRKIQVFEKQEDNGFLQLRMLNKSRASKYHFTSFKGAHHTLYFKLSDHDAPLMLALDLRSSKAMLNQVMTNYPILSLVLGGLLTLTFYNFLYFIYQRDKDFFSLSVFIFAFVMEMGNHVGIFHYYGFLQESLQSIGSLFAFVAIASSIKLTDRMIHIPRRQYCLYKILQGMFWLSCCMALLSPFLIYTTAIAGILAGITGILISYGITVRISKGFRLPRSTLLAYLIFIASVTPTLLIAMGVMERNSNITDFTSLALLIALTLMSLSRAEQIRHQRDYAEHLAASNESKYELLTTMSHELRTPMNAVVNAARLLNLTPLSNKQQAYVGRLGTSSQHMMNLITDILEFARIENKPLDIEIIPFHLKAVLGETLQLLESDIIKKNLKLKLSNEFSTPDKQLLGDPAKLKQILLNLIGNAVKFTHEGTIEIRVATQQQDLSSAKLFFEVRDTGIGITKEQKDRLFHPFSQGDESISKKYGGTGLGLTISQELVKSMGGRLEFDSLPEQGSCFYFTLKFPLTHVIPPQQIDTRHQAPARQMSDYRVLLVDDDEINRFFGKEILEVCGLQATTVQNGKQAIETLRIHTFDLVLMDVSMPEMDGYETTQRIRKQLLLDKLIIIALTAHVVSGEKERCIAAGMNDYLPKPFQLDDLHQVLKIWLNRPTT